MPLAKIKNAPVFRSRRLFGWFREFLQDPLALLKKAQQDVGDIVTIRLANQKTTLLAHPAAIQRVLIENPVNYDKQTRGHKVVKKFLGNSLITSKGAFWKRQRRIIQPVFHKHSLNKLYNKMQKVVEGYFDTAYQGPIAPNLSSTSRDTPAAIETFDIAEEMMQLTLQVAGHSFFGCDLSKESTDIGKAVSDGQDYFTDNFLRGIPGWLPTKTNRNANKAIVELDKLIFRIIGQRRQVQDNDNVNLLDMLMTATDKQSGQLMNDRELRDEAVTMLTAGHETTANALAWTFYFLGKFPDHYAKIQQEVDSLVAGRSPSMEELSSLVYTTQVIKESMRLKPPVWGVPRRAIHDDVICGFRIKSGDMLLLPTFLVHKHSDYWNQPEIFNPLNFSEEVENARKEKQAGQYAYFPFLAGHRKCIGDRFAMMEAVLILATFAKKFSFTLLRKNIVPATSITLRPEGGVPMRITNR